MTLGIAIMTEVPTKTPCVVGPSGAIFPSTPNSSYYATQNLPVSCVRRQLISIEAHERATGFAVGCAARALPRRKLAFDLGCAPGAGSAPMNENLHLGLLPGLGSLLHVHLESK